jgi:predicted Rossmann fold nucleotide-binding protein DprA/Smf involved in DNA uptake
MTSEGTNMLIASGQAKCVRCAWDILEEYFDLESVGEGMTPMIKSDPVFWGEWEKSIYEAIEKGISHVDDISKAVSLPMSDTLIHLSMLEINGYVRMDEMGRYQSQ